MASGGDVGEPAGLGDGALEAHLRDGTFESAGLVNALPETAAQPLRRLLWVKLLGLVSGPEPERWAEELTAHRDAYAALKERHRLEEDVKAADPTICNPLSRHADNPFLKRKANEELLEEIWKDVERTFPEIEFFHLDASRKCIQQVLYHWCKACNPAADASESYRQGMNELAGLCFYVVRHGEHAGMGGLGARLCGRVHNEADTYALFGEIMERGGLREMFAIVRAKPAAKAKAVDVGPMPGMARVRQGPARQPISAVLARCKHIFHNVLKQVDVQLHAYLVEKGVEPQIFLLRWIRLLFCREFHVADTVALWTMIFADAGSVEARDAAFIPYAAADAVDREGVQAAEAASRALPLVDFFAVAMIEFLRMQLLSMDESECLQRLMKFPPVENVATLITLAKRLRAGEAAPIPQLPPPPAPEPTPNPPPQPLPLFLAGSPVRAASQGERPTDAAASPGPADKGSPAVPAPAPVAAAAQDVLRGIISAGRQAVEAGIARAGPGEGTGQARQSREWGRVDLWSGGGGADASSASPQRVAQLEQQVKALEQEKEQLKAKARQFLAAKTQELRDKVAELEGRLRDAEAAGAGPVEAAADGEAVALQDRVARLEAALAAARLEGQRASEAAAAEAAARAAAEEDARGSLRRAEAAERKAAQLAAALEALRRAPGPAQAQSVAPAPAGMPPPEAAEPAVGAADAEAPVPADRPPPDAAAAAELGAEAAEAEAAAPAGSAAPTESAPAESAEVAAAELTADAAAEVGDLM